MSVKAVNSPEEMFDTPDKIDMWLRGGEGEGEERGVEWGVRGSERERSC